MPDGEPCDDGDLCTQADDCAAGACAGDAEPAPACRPASSGSLVVRDLGGAKNALQWDWKKGAATDIGEILPQPYSLCFYEAGGTAAAGSIDTPGLPCSDDHCFKTNSKKTIYKSKTGAFDGVQSITLTAGLDGKASAKLKALGADIPMPPMPLVTPVVVQLRGENGVCIGATYSSTSRNDELQFRASAD